MSGAKRKRKKKKENGRFFHRDILVSIYRQKLVHVEIKTLQNCKKYKNLKKNMVSRNQKFFHCQETRYKYTLVRIETRGKEFLLIFKFLYYENLSIVARNYDNLERSNFIKEKKHINLLITECTSGNEIRISFPANFGNSKLLM